MPDEKSVFHTTESTWSERAGHDGLRAVLSPFGSDRRNQFTHGNNSYAANYALRYFRPGALIIDFGCGTGRFTRFFASHGRRVLATEITHEMLLRAKAECQYQDCEFVITDGVSLPVSDCSVDGIWCCGVLRYSLLVTKPQYAQIAREMFRALRPGTHVVNCEMYLDILPDVFIPDFEHAGFRTQKLSILRRWGGREERLLSHRFVPDRWLPAAGKLCALLRSNLDDPRRKVTGLRDYLFIWQKPMYQRH
jgi:ubiquinone/menaquinone biosynthesis C-methylase UbiE